MYTSINSNTNNYNELQRNCNGHENDSNTKFTETYYLV